MFMNDLLNTALFNLLVNRTQKVTNKEMENAYGCFTEQIKTIRQSENDYLEIFRTLSITRIEFKTLQVQILCEQGKKCV